MTHQSLLDCLLVVVGLCSTLAQAVYLMDDANSTIKYSPTWFRMATTVDYDRTKFYYGGYTRSYCFDFENCNAGIPFTGSGITLYAVVSWSFAFTMSIDGQPPTTHGSDGVPGCCDDGIIPAYNLSFFDVQSLPYGDHMLSITMMNVTSGNHYDSSVPSRSRLFFDYAAVNETNANPTSIPTTAPAPTPTPTFNPPSSPSHVPIGAPIAGAVGGAVLISALAFIVFYVLRRKRSKSSLEVNLQHIIPVSDSGLLHIEGGGPPYMSSTGVDTEGLLTAATIQHAPHATSVLRQPEVGRIAASPPALAVLAPLASTPSASSLGVAPSTQHSTGEAKERFLMPEDTRFFTNLRSLNLPAAEIATMMETLRMEREAANRMEGTSSGIIRPEPEAGPDGAPPGYDFKSN